MRKKVRRNRDITYDVADADLPVFGAIAGRYGDTGRLTMAIQQIITHDFGITRNENPLQGS